MVGGPAAQPADRADCLRVLGRGCGDADRRVDDRHAARTADELVQAAQLLLDGAADLLAEREDALVDDPVVDVVALLAAAEDAGVGEHGEVLGDVLLRGADRLGELADGGLAVAEPVEQLDPHRLADRAEAAGDQLDQVIGKRMGKRHLSSPCGINEIVVELYSTEKHTTARRPRCPGT